jgi:hypothetical protein
MSAQKILKAHRLKIFFIATFTISSIFYSFVIVKKSLEYTHILDILGVFVWIISYIFYVCVQSNNLLDLNSEHILNAQEQYRYQLPPRVKKSISVYTAFILGILLLLLFGSNFDIFKTQILMLSESELESFSDYSYIAMGISFTVGTLRDLFGLKKSLLNSILLLFEFMLLVPVVIALYIYLSHFTEVS